MPEAPTLQFVSHKGGKLAYRDAGKGPALLFLHGMNGNSKSWTFAFQALSNRFRVVAWDAPSCGKSDSFGDTIKDYVAAAKALIHTLDLQDVVIIGHSMGGLVATSLAAEPDMPVTGLILSSTHLGFSIPSGRPLMPRYATRIQRLESKGAGMEYGIERARRNTPENTSEEVVSFLADIAKDIRLEQIRDGGRMSQETNNAALGEKIQVPIIILSGGKDTVISTDMHAALTTAFPAAKQIIFPNAGHASYAECPEQYHTEVKNFVDKTMKYNQRSKA
ncbi:alpha/beta hydrolase [Alphaproteobacteria bacterium]|nr:alpha/beta hydrolase [Alphaproteobacteria bacterium]